jgi:hypothetical protein
VALHSGTADASDNGKETIINGVIRRPEKTIGVIRWPRPLTVKRIKGGDEHRSPGVLQVGHRA